MSTYETFVSFLLTVAVFSLLYRENPLYAGAEHIYVGLSAGHFVVMGYNNIKSMAITPLSTGKFIVLIPIILGLALYSRFLQKWSWISRYPVCFLTGLGVGLSICGTIAAQFVAQVRAGMMALNSLNNIIAVAITASVILFFTFTGSRNQGAVKTVLRFGRWAMMVAFGVTFGGTVMGAMTLLAGRIQFLLSVLTGR